MRNTCCKNEMKYRINEIFYSLQGEGRNTGRAAVFVRFSGCNLRCPFCDTDFKEYTEMTADEILETIRPWKRCGFVVLTGGEPSLQTDDDLVEALHQEGFYIAMETNGTHSVPEGIDWVTVSPKAGSEVVIDRADELKVVFDGKENPDSPLTTHHLPLTTQKYLQPCDTGNEEQNRQIIQQCVEYIKEHPEWRLSLQTHKLIDIR